LREQQAAKEKSNLAAKLGVTVIPYDAISPLPQGSTTPQLFYFLSISSN